MTHTMLRLVTYKEDPSEQVIWDQERPIAYLNRADATVDEFIELEKLIQSAPEMEQLIADLIWWAKGPKEYKNEINDQY